jgi:UDP-glucose 4-epimerase
MPTSSSSIKQALVTGGAGAIGSRLVRRLLDDGAESVVVLDDLSSGYQWLLPEDKRIQLLVRDVCTLDAKETLGLSQPTVFHLAAFFANQNSVDHPQDDLHTNGKGTLQALMWAAHNRARRLVYASAGCSIAGHNVDAPIREDMPVSLHLDTPYQITKALGEFYCNYYLGQVSSVRCRFFNSFGPGEVPGPYRNVIPNFIWWALKGKPLPITGTGEETRDFIFVDDMVDGLMKSATVEAAHGEALNLGTGEQTRIIDLAKMVLEECGSKSELEFKPRRSWDHSVRRQADVSKAARLLDHKPAVSVREGVKRTVAWFRENQERIQQTMKVEL